MADPTIFKIFLSSPGDVPGERDDAQAVIDEINASGEFAHHFILKLYRWDDKATPLPMEAAKMPQSSVDTYMILPSQCDLTVVLFWSRMGSPLVMDGREYLSGTHYEYTEALQSAKPAVWLYRCVKEPVINLDDPQRDEKNRQYDQVVQFFKQFKDAEGRYTGGVNEYKTHPDFKVLFKGQLITYLRHLRDNSLPSTRSRRFEAAMPSRIIQDAPTEIWAKISLPNSTGLRGELPAVVPSGDVIAKEDARATGFPFKFPLDPLTGMPTSVLVTVRARSKNLMFDRDELEVELPPDADSQTMIFYAELKDNIVPVSRIRVLLELNYENKLISQVSVTALVKEAVRSAMSLCEWVVATAILIDSEQISASLEDICLYKVDSTRPQVVDTSFRTVKRDDTLGLAYTYLKNDHKPYIVVVDKADQPIGYLTIGRILDELPPNIKRSPEEAKKYNASVKRADNIPVRERMIPLARVHRLLLKHTWIDALKHFVEEHRQDENTYRVRSTLVFDGQALYGVLEYIRLLDWIYQQPDLISDSVIEIEPIEITSATVEVDNKHVIAKNKTLADLFRRVEATAATELVVIDNQGIPQGTIHAEEIRNLNHSEYPELSSKEISDPVFQGWLQPINSHRCVADTTPLREVVRTFANGRETTVLYRIDSAGKLTGIYTYVQAIEAIIKSVKG